MKNKIECCITNLIDVHEIIMDRAWKFMRKIQFERYTAKMPEIIQTLKECASQSSESPAIPQQPLCAAGQAKLPSSEIMEEIIATLKHARVFISSREKMHPAGIELYDSLLEKLGNFTKR